MQEYVNTFSVILITSNDSQATRRGQELGPSDRSTVAKILGRMDKKGRAWPVTDTTRCYVVRQWKLMRKAYLR